MTFHSDRNFPRHVDGRVFWRRVKRKFSHIICRVGLGGSSGWLSDDDLLKAVNDRFARVDDLLSYWAARQPPAFFAHPMKQAEIVETFRSVCGAEAVDRIVAVAEKACAHTFDLLGSGDYTFEERIDWHLDFKSGQKFDPQKYYADFKPAPYPGGYDIKVPWELSRCQHFVWLAQAYWLNGDERFAQEFTSQVLDWISQNPPKRGVNWACTMDVAIRAVNWLWAYAFFESSPAITPAFLKDFLKSLLVHGRHIMDNLEWSETLTSNHYLADLAGLVYLGCLLPEFTEAQTWREFGLAEIEKEMEKQVFTDGVDFEASTAYHRLVTEMFLSVTLLAQLHGHVFSQAYIERLEKMFDYILYMTRTDGTVALFGDNDNGRLHRLGVPQEKKREWVDYRYLLAAGAPLFERTDYAAAAGAEWQEAVWLWGETALEWRRKADAFITPSLHSRLFEAGGMAVMRYTDMMLNVDVGGVGLNGLGAHAHNDTLSIELFGEGHTWIKDPGTGIYTGDYLLRNSFRSTAVHSGVMIDNEEINQLDDKSPFSIQEDAVVNVEKWITNDEYDILVASHTGYERLPNPVTHRRTVFFQKADRDWIVRDVFNGNGVHDVDIYFHFGDVEVIDGDAVHISLSAPGKKSPHLHILPIPPIEFEMSMGEAASAIGYGVWRPTPLARYHRRSTLPFEFRVFLAILPEEGEKDFASLQDRAIRAWQRFDLSGFNTM